MWNRPNSSLSRRNPREKCQVYSERHEDSEGTSPGDDPESGRQQALNKRSCWVFFYHVLLARKMTWPLGFESVLLQWKHLLPLGSLWPQKTILPRAWKPPLPPPARVQRRALWQPHPHPAASKNPRARTPGRIGLCFLCSLCLFEALRRHWEINKPACCWPWECLFPTLLWEAGLTLAHRQVSGEEPSSACKRRVLVSIQETQV